MSCQLLINVDVDDINRAMAFYCSAFGLSIGRRFGTLGVELLGATSPLYLLVKQAGTRPTPASGVNRDYGRHWTPVHLDLVVGDVDAAVARALSAGAVLEGEVVRHVWGRIAQMTDPLVTASACCSSMGAVTTRSPIRRSRRQSAAPAALDRATTR